MEIHIGEIEAAVRTRRSDSSTAKESDRSLGADFTVLSEMLKQELRETRAALSAVKLDTVQ